LSERVLLQVLSERVLLQVLSEREQFPYHTNSTLK
jgi:hypothetical protein